MTGDRHTDPDAGRDVERRLRQRLQAAAEGAPTFDPAGWAAHERRQDSSGSNDRPRTRVRGRRPVIAVAAAVLAVIVAGGLWLRLAPGTGNISGGGAAGSCAEILTRNQHQYQPYDSVRVPRPGRILGRAYWCRDTGPASQTESEVVYALSGVPADQGFLVNGRIWLRTDLAHTPSAVRRLQQPVSCRRPGTLTGRIEQFDGHPIGEPVKISVPYTLAVRIDHGLGSIGLQNYANVAVTVRVTSATRGADAITRLAAQRRSQPQYVRARVVCHGHGFVATTIQRR